MTERGRALFGISKAEQPKILLLFALFFLVMAAFWGQKPIRTSKEVLYTPLDEVTKF